MAEVPEAPLTPLHTPYLSGQGYYVKKNHEPFWLEDQVHAKFHPDTVWISIENIHTHIALNLVESIWQYI